MFQVRLFVRFLAKGCKALSYSIMLYVALSTHGIKSFLQRLIAAIPITNEEVEALRNLSRIAKLVTWE